MQYILCAPVGDPVGGGAGGSTIPSAIANARLDVSRVERAFVVPKTANDYIGQLIRFLLHLFDNHKGLIPDPYLAQMAMFNANDARNTFQEKCTRKDGEDTRSELRGYIRRIINNILPAREGAPHNSPFKIDGNDALTYEVIRDYMSTKYYVVEVEKEAAIKYRETSEQVTNQMKTGPRKVKVEAYQSESTFSAIRSAVAYVYKTARVAIPDDMSRELSICPVLALARYLFCYPEVLRGDVPLFEGTNQYARYSASMLKFYKEHQDDLKRMGIDYKSLGSHSARKGVGTMVASGCTIGPPIVPLCLRAGWKLGGVKDKYLSSIASGCTVGLPIVPTLCLRAGWKFGGCRQQMHSRTQETRRIRTSRVDYSSLSL